MSEDQNMLADMADGLFQSLGTGATMERDWAAIDEVALSGLLLAEDAGGFGGTWDDALLVFRLAGYHALALPLVEAILAAALSGQAQGRGTIASAAEGLLTRDHFTGNILGLCYADGAQFAVAPCPAGDLYGGAMVVDLTDITVSPSTNVAGEPRADALIDAPIRRVAGDVFAMGALARVAQIAGALDAALAKSVEYANDRQQFGRTLAKFQAVQQNLATFACEAAAVNCAAMGAAQAMAHGVAPFEIAAAKIRANRAVGVGTAMAHQVHGGIGFTIEYPLHPLTRRLWAWRSEFGNDAFWGKRLGAQITERGAANFWPDLTALTD